MTQSYRACEMAASCTLHHPWEHYRYFYDLSCFFDFRNTGKWYAEAVFGAQAGGIWKQRKRQRMKKKSKKAEFLRQSACAALRDFC